MRNMLHFKRTTWIFQIYTDRNPENMLGVDLLSVWDNDGRNIKMDLAEFIDMEPLNRDSAFKFAAGKGVRNVDNSLLVWFVETWIKKSLCVTWKYPISHSLM